MKKLDRRQFMAVAALASGNAALANAETVSVKDFGADPTGKADSTSAIQNAISHLVESGARTLYFPLGTYKLGAPQRIALSLTGYSNFELAGSGSTLLMGTDALCLELTRCSNVVVSNLTIDWDPLPCTQGVVSGSGSGWFEVKVDSGFPTPSNVALGAVESYDRALRNVARNLIEMGADQNLQMQPAGDGKIRVRLNRLSPVPVGTVVVLRFKGNHEAIRITRSHNVSFTGVKLFSSYSMGYNISYCDNLAFRQCSIGFKPDSTRLLSTNADGMHVTNCSGSLAIDRCTFEGMGDDAINITASMWRAQRQANGEGAVLLSRSGAPIGDDDAPKAGDELEILDPGDLHVRNRQSSSSSTHTLAGSVAQDSLIDDVSRVPTTKVSGCHFLGNHSRAILAHANLEVTDCLFQNISLAAIMIAPDAHWMEGPTTRNIVIDSNSFTGCHYATADPEGSVTIDIEQTYGRRTPVPRATAQDVHITNNRFDDCYTSAISCRSIAGLRITGNRIGRTWVGGGNHPAILLGELRNSFITGNISTASNAIAMQDSDTTDVSGNQGFSQKIDSNPVAPLSPK
jgi:hypothetical protein